MPAKTTLRPPASETGKPRDPVTRSSSPATTLRTRLDVGIAPGDGVTLEGVKYGPVQATLDRVQRGNAWITMGLREGKNREVRRLLESIGLKVNRLIRVSYGPFQLGNLDAGEVEEVNPKTLDEQLGLKPSKKPAWAKSKKKAASKSAASQPKAKKHADRRRRP